MDMITDAQHVAQHEAARASGHAGGEFLTSRLGDEECGIGSAADRMPILMDIEALMSCADMGLLNTA